MKKQCEQSQLGDGKFKYRNIVIESFTDKEDLEIVFIKQIEGTIRRIA